MGQQDAKGVAAGPADALHALASRAAHTHQLLTSKGVKFFSTAARPGAAAHGTPSAPCQVIERVALEVPADPRRRPVPAMDGCDPRFGARASPA